MTGAALLRQRRAAAAHALAQHPRRAQLGWDDLAAWPDWAGLAPGAQHALACRCGAWLHAGALRRSLSGPLLQRVRALVGDAAFARLMTGPDEAGAPLPAAEEAEAWLAHEGFEALVASVPSPPLRMLLRERLLPGLPPPLPALDDARARQAVAEAQR